MGVEYLETDLQQTKDGVIILLHDDNVTRVSNVASVFPNRTGFFFF
jgi:glycerophosphoryl diester phosphodiesterase